MDCIRGFRVISAIGFLFYIVGAIVASSHAAAEDDNKAGMEYGISPELRYDDNIYRSDATKTDSWILQAKPFVRGTFFNDGNTYQLEYLLDHAEYFDASKDTFTDHHFTVDINHRFTHRQAVVAKASYKMLTEARGTGFSEEPGDVTDSPDDYNHLNLELSYLLGVPTADLRFEFYGKHNELDFSSSYVGDTRDYKSDQLGVISRYRLGARTNVLLEYRRLMVAYDNIPLDFSGNPINLDSNEDYYLVGMAWEMTAKTKGEVKIGQSKRDFDDNEFSNSDFHWEANLEWRPKSYSRLLLKTSRTSQETYGSGLYINSQAYDLAWQHDWPGRLRSEINLGLIDDTFEGSDRQDDRAYWGAQLGYDYATWLAVELGYKYRENVSTFDLVDYEQNLFFIRALVEF